MTLEAKLREAAFWDEWVCLNCGHAAAERETVEMNCSCSEGSECPVKARSALSFLAMVDEERTLEAPTAF